MPTEQEIFLHNPFINESGDSAGENLKDLLNSEEMMDVAYWRYIQAKYIENESRKVYAQTKKVKYLFLREQNAQMRKCLYENEEKGFNIFYTWT
jgi:hypothetical protein